MSFGDRKSNWMLKPVAVGFESIMVVHGTEAEMQEYMKSEFGHVPAYSAVDGKRLEAYKLLGGKVYLAPELEG